MKPHALLPLLLCATFAHAGTVTIQTTVETGRSVLAVFPTRGGFEPRCLGGPTQTAADFACFLSRFAALDLYGDADGHGWGESPALNVADFSAFLRGFVAGPRLPLTMLSGSINLQTLPHAYNEPPVLVEYTVNNDAWMISLTADPVTGVIAFDFGWPGFLMRDDGVSGRWVVVSFQ